MFVGLTCVSECAKSCFSVSVSAYFGLPAIICISACILSSSADCEYMCVCVSRSRWRINSVKYDLQEPNMLACLCLWKSQCTMGINNYLSVQP